MTNDTTRAKRSEFRTLCAVLVVAVAGATPVVAVAGQMAIAVADDADAGRSPQDDAGPDVPGSAPGFRDFDAPSEDGTEDEPSAARPGTVVPDQPSGCRFRDGPLELVV